MNLTCKASTTAVCVFFLDYLLYQISLNLSVCIVWVEDDEIVETAMSSFIVFILRSNSKNINEMLVEIY